jgi:hypothetical protein
MYELYQRCLKVKLMVREHLEKDPLGTGEKMAIICHRHVIECLTATDAKKVVDPNDPLHTCDLDNPHYASNCEVIPWL